jgi:murein DD-endopeptidase MepM/ murein hydrolase activator NlpD
LASSRYRRSRSVATITALAVSFLVAVAGIASAAETATVETATISAGGGMGAPGTPKIRDVICLSSCVGLRKGTVGGTVQVSGSDLRMVTKMTFASEGTRVRAEVTKATERTAEAEVPVGAITGKVRVKDEFGNASRLSAVELEIHPRSALGTAGQLQLTEAEATPHKAYFFGVRAPRLNYVIGSDLQLNDLRIDIVDRDGAIVKSFFRNDIEANTTQSIRWNGKGSDGKAVRSGAYQFRVSSQTGERAARNPQRREGGSLGFKLFGFIFPIRGPHTYGDGIGAARAGHTHQGQDVFAACGTKLVAVRGGRVQYAGYHSAAGNYIVIDGRATGVDFAYMHLVSPTPFREGQMVRTGQKIGEVGESGNASGCHLHYEMWAPPGWYEGGHFMDPTPALKRWDRYS